MCNDWSLHWLWQGKFSRETALCFQNIMWYLLRVLIVLDTIYKTMINWNLRIFLVSWMPFQYKLGWHVSHTYISLLNWNVTKSAHILIPQESHFNISPEPNALLGYFFSFLLLDSILKCSSPAIGFGYPINSWVIGTIGQYDNWPLHTFLPSITVKGGRNLGR